MSTKLVGRRVEIFVPKILFRFPLFRVSDDRLTVSPFRKNPERTVSILFALQLTVSIDHVDWTSAFARSYAQ